MTCADRGKRGSALFLRIRWLWSRSGRVGYWARPWGTVQRAVVQPHDHNFRCCGGLHDAPRRFFVQDQHGCNRDATVSFQPCRGATCEFYPIFALSWNSRHNVESVGRCADADKQTGTVRSRNFLDRYAIATEFSVQIFDQCSQSAIKVRWALPFGSECLLMPDTRPGQATARRLACSGRGSSVP